MISILVVEILVLLVLMGLASFFHDEYSWLKTLAASRKTALKSQPLYLPKQAQMAA